MSAPRRFRPLAVVLYAAFLGLLLASYISPLEGIISGHAEGSALEQQLEEGRAHNTEQERLKEDLNADELDQIELVMDMEDIFELSIPDVEADRVRTVGQWIDYVRAHVKR